MGWIAFSHMRAPFGSTHTLHLVWQATRRLSTSNGCLEKGWYAVKQGAATGVFMGWANTSPKVLGFPGALFKGFHDRDTAVAWLNAAPYRPLAEDAIRAVDSYRLECDGGARGSHTGKGIVGYGALLIHESSGGVVQASAGFLYEQDTCVTAECRALVLGLKAAASLQIVPSVVHTDNKSLAGQLSEFTATKSKFWQALKQEVDDLCCRRSARTWHVKHVLSESNEGADQLSNLAQDFLLWAKSEAGTSAQGKAAHVAALAKHTSVAKRALTASVLDDVWSKLQADWSSPGAQDSSKDRLEVTVTYARPAGTTERLRLP